jgi:hypothetical protein
MTGNINNLSFSYFLDVNIAKQQRTLKGWRSNMILKASKSIRQHTNWIQETTRSIKIGETNCFIIYLRVIKPQKMG